MGFNPAAWAVDLTWKNQFTFYGDNTEFFEPFRTGETLLGQQGKSRLEVALGKKIFISGGEQDLTENIIHLVLARIEGAPEGTKGISLFVVPKRRINADGSLGEKNGVYCGSIEESRIR